MNTRTLILIAVLSTATSTGSATAASIDLGTVIVDFDATSFVNISSGYSSGPDLLLFSPGASVGVPDSGGESMLDYFATFSFIAKPGYSITGYTLQGSGTGYQGAYSTAAITGTFVADASAGNWSQLVNLGAQSTVSVGGTLAAVSTPVTSSSIEQIGTEIRQIGQHELITYLYEVVGQEPKYAEVPYFVFGGVDINTGELIYVELCCETILVGYSDIYDYVAHSEIVPDFGEFAIYGQVFRTDGTPAAISFDSLSLQVNTVPLPMTWPLLSCAIFTLALVRRRPPKRRPRKASSAR